MHPQYQRESFGQRITCKEGEHQYCPCPTSLLDYERRSIQNCSWKMSTTSRYFKKLRGSQLNICIEWLASRLWLSTLKQFWMRTEVKLSTLLQWGLGIAGWEPGMSGSSPDLGVAVRFLTQAGEGTCRGSPRGHRLRGMEYDPWDLLSTLLHVSFSFFCLISSFLSLPLYLLFIKSPA